MFGWGKENMGSQEPEYPETVIVEEPPKPEPEKVPDPQTYEAKPDLSSLELEEYLKVCEEIGLTNNADVISQKLLCCFKEENIHVYNGSQVVNYLDKELGDTWQWRGLRDSDVEHLAGWSQDYKNARDVSFSDRKYNGAIPLPVLLTVKKIMKAVPEAHFYVSATEEDGDPFLSVAHRNSPTYIVERWNEPGFRER